METPTLGYLGDHNVTSEWRGRVPSQYIEGPVRYQVTAKKTNPTQSKHKQEQQCS